MLHKTLGSVRRLWSAAWGGERVWIYSGLCAVKTKNMTGEATKNLPPKIAAEWLAPFLEFLEKERRYSAYTVRNYRQAFEDFWRWLDAAGLWTRGIERLGPRDVRDFVIEAQRRFGRRTLHNHVSGLRAFFKFWIKRDRLGANPFIGLALPKLEKALPKFLTEKQMVELLAGPLRLLENKSLDAFTAWRDRLLLEPPLGGGPAAGPTGRPPFWAEQIRP